MSSNSHILVCYTETFLDFTPLFFKVYLQSLFEYQKGVRKQHLLISLPYYLIHMSKINAKEQHCSNLPEDLYAFKVN